MHNVRVIFEGSKKTKRMTFSSYDVLSNDNVPTDTAANRIGPLPPLSRGEHHGLRAFLIAVTKFGYFVGKVSCMSRRSLISCEKHVRSIISAVSAYSQAS